MPLFAGLYAGQPKPPPTPLHRLLGPIEFLFINLLLTFEGLPKAIFHQLTHPNPLKLISPWAWRDLVLKFGFAKLLKGSDINHAKIKAPLIEMAYGRILEVGAGSGMTIKYYNPDKVTELIAIEPFTELRPELAQAISTAGLDKKATILTDGIDERAALATQGVTEASFDTIVLVQVLCSVPNPKEQIAFLTSLLKPGGQILLFEHVGSKDTITRTLQRIFRPYWLFATQCCDLVRDSGDWITAQGGWSSVQVETPAAEDSSVLFPHAVGRFVKAS
ncbi:hypothetical protein OC835_000133 [Tilletia horrida]|nr:hypothetical protein OC835_000133 [Tilletia horrida]